MNEDFERNTMKMYWQGGHLKDRELPRLKWLYPEDLADAEAIREERHAFCKANDWDYSCPLDNYDGDLGAVMWWNEKIIADLKEGTRYSNDWKEATVTEKNKFYNSLDWDYIKYLVFLIERGVCQKCHSSLGRQEYDHMHPVFPESHRMFYRNFWIDNIQTLCEACHKSKHISNQRQGDYFVPRTDWSKVDWRKL